MTGISSWNNAAEILGKDPGSVTTVDKVQAAGAGVLEGLTFGLVNKQMTIGAANKLIEWTAPKQEIDHGPAETAPAYQYFSKQLE
jgi:hypothetical protein